MKQKVFIEYIVLYHDISLSSSKFSQVRLRVPDQSHTRRFHKIILRRFRFVRIFGRFNVRRRFLDLPGVRENVVSDRVPGIVDADEQQQ